jgi:hypothetical protein
MKYNEKYIPGIYNYCDRWCERCSFTTRCLNFESTGKLSSEQLDISNEAFWKTIADIFKKTIEILRKAAAEYGFDIDNIPEEETKAHEKKEKMTRETMKNHPISKTTLDYTKKAKAMFENNPMLKEKSEELVKNIEMGLRNEEQIMEEAISIKDSIEIIQWYLFFIHVKFARALHGLIEDDGWSERTPLEEAKNDFQRDCDGSAKIALIASQRSMEAWMKINELIPGNEDDIIPLLASLQKIIRTGNEIFPKAKTFIRPGFDEL